MLHALGYDLMAADSRNSVLEDIPTANLIRQVLGEVWQLANASLISKLQGARDRNRMSLRKISTTLAEAGDLNERGMSRYLRSNGLNNEPHARRLMRWTL